MAAVDMERIEKSKLTAIVSGGEETRKNGADR
jgi:hypothetical protein